MLHRATLPKDFLVFRSNSLRRRYVNHKEVHSVHVRGYKNSEQLTTLTLFNNKLKIMRLRIFSTFLLTSCLFSSLHAQTGPDLPQLSSKVLSGDYFPALPHFHQANILHNPGVRPTVGQMAKAQTVNASVPPLPLQKRNT